MSSLGRAVDSVFERLARFWHAPAPPERLASVRIISGLFATVYVALRFKYFASYAKLAAAQFKPIGVVSVLDAPLPAGATWAAAAVVVLSGIAFTIGFRYRVIAPIFGASLLWVLTYRSSWGMIFHTENLLCMHIVALSLAPGAADAYSFDAKALSEPAPEAHGRYGWPLRLVCGVTVLAYFVAGATKLRNSGIGWFQTDLLQHYVAYDAIRKAELGSMHSSLGGYLSESHPWVFKPLAAMSLIIELGAPLALFHRRIAKVWVASIIAFHAGVLAIMAILFAYPMFGFAFASFFDVERLVGKLLALWRGRRAQTA